MYIFYTKGGGGGGGGGSTTRVVGKYQYPIVFEVESANIGNCRKHLFKIYC